MSLSGARCNVVADGVSQCRFSETGDHFSWSKVTTQVNGIIIGTMAITHFGEMKVVNHTTGEACVLEFERHGLLDFGPEQGRITGALRSQSGAARYALEGSWDVHAGNLCAASAAPAAAPAEGASAEGGAAAAGLEEKVVMAPGEEPAELFRVAARPADSARQYNFTQFAIGLNQRPGPARRHGGAVGLPAPTDTTLRPDVRAMEEGNITLAADEKHRLETKQRAARKVRKDSGEHGRQKRTAVTMPASFAGCCRLLSFVVALMSDARLSGCFRRGAGAAVVPKREGRVARSRRVGLQGRVLGRAGGRAVRERRRSAARLRRPLLTTIGQLAQGELQGVCCVGMSE